MRLKALIQILFPTIKAFFISIFSGIAGGGFIYFGFLQRHFFSFRYLLYALIIVAISTIISAWINQKFLIPRLQNLPKAIRIFTISISLLLTIFLLFNIKIQPFYYILPDTSLEINFTISDIPENEEGVRLKWIETGQGYVPYTYIDYYGKWSRILGNTFFSPEQTVKMVWTGKVGTDSEIAFRKTAYHQPISISWNGEIRTYNLQGSPKDDLLIQNAFKIDTIYFLPYGLSAGIFLFYITLNLVVAVGSWKPNYLYKASTKKFNWVLFAIPMLIIWFFILLVFWPGILTSDSLTIWYKAKNGSMDDWQSAFYILILSFLTKLFHSPGPILVIQIIVFSLVVARGLWVLEWKGLPKIILWLISMLMAIFPPNLVYAITLWKDIPYAICMLLLTIFLAEIVWSNGNWIRKTNHWIALGVTAFLVAIFRHNGVPSAFLSLIFLPFIFKKHWKPLLGSIIIACLSFFIVKGPLYDLIIENKRESDQTNLVYLHHIGAHLEAGTEFTQTEQQYLDQFLPVSKWDYDCCYVGSLSYDPGLERTAFLQNSNQNRNLAIQLFLRNPFVDISHALCAGELSYKFMNTQQCGHMKSLHGFNSTKPGREDWIGDIYNTGIQEHSFFPGLLQPILSILRVFGFFDSNFVIYLRPAFWLFLSLIAAAIWIVRAKNLSAVIIIIPILSQSLFLLLIGFAPAFRYYYSNCIIGIFTLGYIFLPCKYFSNIGKNENKK